MTYQDPDPLRDSDLDRDARIDRNYGSNAMWGWIAGAVVLVLTLVFLFGGPAIMQILRPTSQTRRWSIPRRPITLRTPRAAQSIRLRPRKRLAKAQARPRARSSSDHK